MAKYRVQGPDGAVHVFEGPDDATPEQVTAFAAQTFAPSGAAPSPPKQAPKDEPGLLTSVAAGLGKGAGNVGLGAQHWLGKGLQTVGLDTAGDWLVKDAAEGRKKLEGEVAPYKQAHPLAAGAGEMGGEIIMTLPVGGAIAAPVKAGAKAVPALAPVADAIATSGMRAAGATGLPANLAARTVGGAITGGASAGLANPEDWKSGAVVGGALPVVGQLAAQGGKAAAGLVRPFFKSGQEKIAGDVLREFASDPQAAAAALKTAQEVIPGSAPTAVMAAGDVGLAGLGRTMQSASDDYAAEVANRAAAQNAARTAAIEGIAGNTGKLEAARAARDTATGAMREAALDAAGVVPADRVIGALDSMLKNPSNAGRISQQALTNVKDQIGQFVKDGGIDARALYAIRKDINDVLDGKLQGEAGNLKYASGQLIKVKNMIDNAIEMAGNRVPQTGTAVMPAGANIARSGAAPIGATGPRASWKQYLSEYAKQSVPINQMELLDDVMKRVQTGTVDSSGNLVLSAAKLNNILKNEGKDLLKNLSPEQVDTLRRLAADLNASQLATNAGKAAGSNTVQNLAGTNVLTSVLGGRLGNSTPVASTVGRVLELPYGRANKQIMGRVGDALMDPAEAARLLEQKPDLLGDLFSRTGARQLTYRAAPLLAP